jgi:hypothetical protein
MKKITWENWNEKEIELVEGNTLENFAISDDIEEENEQILASIGNNLSPLLDFQPQVLHTPFGVVPSDSILKPSDRWQCWMGYTNFDLTHKVSDKMKIVDGVEALRIMSRYTFCVGVGKVFNFTKVRKDIENAICK